MNRFKSGQKVRCIVKNCLGFHRDEIGEVVSVPGMPEYDSWGYGGADEGMMVKQSDGKEWWVYQEDFKLLEKESQMNIEIGKYYSIRVKVDEVEDGLVKASGWIKEAAESQDEYERTGHDEELKVGHIYKLSGGAVVWLKKLDSDGHHLAHHLCGGPAKTMGGLVHDEQYFYTHPGSRFFHVDEWLGAVDVTEKIESLWPGGSGR